MIEDDRRALWSIRLRAERGELDGGAATVQAGAATPRVSLNQFLPARVSIDAGQAVTG